MQLLTTGSAKNSPLAFGPGLQHRPKRANQHTALRTAVYVTRCVTVIAALGGSEPGETEESAVEVIVRNSPNGPIEKVSICDAWTVQREPLHAGAVEATYEDRSKRLNKCVSTSAFQRGGARRGHSTTHTQKVS